MPSREASDTVANQSVILAIHASVPILLPSLRARFPAPLQADEAKSKAEGKFRVMRGAKLPENLVGMLRRSKRDHHGSGCLQLMRPTSLANEQGVWELAFRYLCRRGSQ